MSDVLLDEQNLYDIADAIREKLGVQTEYLPSEMASAIGSIAGTLGTKTITENGTYNATDDDLDGYSQVTVNVGGTEGIIFGTTAPDASQGNDGDYYYRRVKEPVVGVGYWDNKQNSSTSISGYRFTTTENCVVVGVRVYNRGSARTVTAGIYESNGTAIEEVTAEASANGWTTLMFEHSHTLQDATTYYSLANWGETGHTVYRSTYTIATDARITSLVGAYDSTSNPSIDNSNVYGCDLLLENPSGDYYIITEQYVKEDGAWVRLNG